MLLCRMGMLQYVYLLSLTYQGYNLFAIKANSNILSTFIQIQDKILGFKFTKNTEMNTYCNIHIGIKSLLNEGIMKSILHISSVFVFYSYIVQSN